MVIATKRSIMTVYSRSTDPYSHRVRLVLAEKGITYEVVDIDHMPKALEEMMESNPYGNVPTLVDRDLVLYKSEIIMEYLDERFPHPPLLPIYPVARGRSRLMMYRVNHDWYSKMNVIMRMRQHNNGNPSPEDLEIINKARQELLDSLVSTVPVFAEMPYFLSEEFSLVDCLISVLLWRLPVMGVQLPDSAKPIKDYMKRIFARESFQQSLTDAERTMRMYGDGIALTTD